MQSLTQLIDEAIKKENSKERVRSHKYSPSSFGYCYRRQWWNKQGEIPTNPPDERTLRIFKVGKIFHDWIQKLLGDDVQSEVLIENDNFKGYADIVNTDAVYDIKTIHSKGFWYLTRTDDIKKEKYQNWLQVMWYAIQLQKQYAILCFVSKDDLCLQEYKLEVDDYWKKEVLKETSVLEELISLPEPIPRCFISTKEPLKECLKYCPYRDKCFELQGKPIPTKEVD